MQSSRDNADTKNVLKNLAGVYKEKFINRDFTGSSCQLEDILEIVPIDSSTAYLRLDVESFNGHGSRVYGPAHVVEKNTLVFNTLGGKSAQVCIFTIKYNARKIHFLDDPEYGCTPKFCSARGTFAQKIFQLKKKRTIRYLDRLRKSKEYLVH